MVSTQLARRARTISMVFCFSAVLAGAGLVSAATISDDFNTSHDYSGKSVAGTIWSGVMYNDGFDVTQNTVVLVANANTTNAGRLTITTTNGNWSGANDDGFFLYINVSGDFVATVQVTSYDSPTFNNMGLLARAANAADGGDLGEDWLRGDHFANQSQMRFVSADNSVNTILAGGVMSLHPFLRLSRTGDDFTFAWADDAGFTINVGTAATSTRSDLAGLPLQVGIWQASFSASAGTAVFDNFSLTTASDVVPEPSTYALAFIGLMSLGLVTWRRRLR